MAKSHSNAAQLRRVLRLFGVFGHPIRVVIFQRVARVPSSAGELERTLPITRTAIVQHLKLMEAAGIVRASSEGRRRVYRVKADGLAPLVQWLSDHHRDGT